MTRATLTLDSGDSLQGDAETGGDYVRLHLETKTAPNSLTGARGQIEIDGRTSKVLVEDITPAAEGDGETVTLRLFTPTG